MCAAVPIHVFIAAMEGNGPPNGNARPLRMILFPDDPTAADATCARSMGFEPIRIVHLREGSRCLGNSAPAPPRPGWTNCQYSRDSLPGGPEFRYLHAKGGWVQLRLADVATV